jgi:hypothetical protein
VTKYSSSLVGSVSGEEKSFLTLAPGLAEGRAVGTLFVLAADVEDTVGAREAFGTVKWCSD